ncbi:Slp family lipoprotein [Vibrio sp. 10N.222.51.C8]|jgi:outer membrane lipoprotein|uniref:Starvation-inducible protein n=1 Tax=Vibrio splendidus TaxID=29497 RepID=A0A1C3IKE1_VIBSP|nr:MULTISPECIES: Slp family lipoprotein [Vibrio]MBB1464365.1 Slp family lipoprotein [Vibrio sp. SG41-7]MCT4348608.1 Slp family lipoprotein [Vibrio sp. NC2]MDH5915151.1 Slp family lipoprotein [Vibrio splendidus]MDH6024901.1 Slp family lipoprotein [Vibrio splendidus]OED85455.1 starvation-inducible protein [Vibrio splendidus ZF-90]
MFSLISKSRLFFLVAFSSMVMGCSSLPEELNANSEQVVTDYQEWVNTVPDAGDVRLGGVIAKVTNLQDKTRVEVVNLPISSNGKPDIDAEPKGRFVGYIDGYVEPLSFAEGRLVTLVGTSSGTEDGTVGDYPYTFPVMNVYNQRLWQITERVVINDFAPTYYSCRSLHCRSFQTMPKSGRVIQDVE